MMMMMMVMMVMMVMMMMMMMMMNFYMESHRVHETLEARQRFLGNVFGASLFEVHTVHIRKMDPVSHRIHVCMAYLYLQIYHKFESNAGDYISYTDPIWVMVICKG